MFCGCAAVDHTVSVDPSFSEAQSRQIAEAVECWNQVAIDRITIVPNGHTVILRERGPIVCGPAKSALGCYRPREGQIAIHENLRNVRPVVLHELGHMLGMSHVEGGIMSTNLYLTAINAVDIAECRRIGACY
jgi:hypothetical protein